MLPASGLARLARSPHIRKSIGTFGSLYMTKGANAVSEISLNADLSNLNWNQHVHQGI